MQVLLFSCKLSVSFITSVLNRTEAIKFTLVALTAVVSDENQVEQTVQPTAEWKVAMMVVLMARQRVVLSVVPKVVLTAALWVDKKAELTVEQMVGVWADQKDESRGIKTVGYWAAPMVEKTAVCLVAQKVVTMVEKKVEQMDEKKVEVRVVCLVVQMAGWKDGHYT